MTAATLTLGSSFASFHSFLSTYFATLQQPDDTAVLAALGADYTVTSSSDTLVNEVSLDGRFQIVLAGSGFGTDPHLGSLAVYDYGLPILQATFGSTEYDFVLSDGVISEQLVFRGSGLPTDAATIIELLGASPPAVGTVTFYSQTVGADQRSYTFTSSSQNDVVIDGYRITENGTLPSGLAGNFISAISFGTSFIYPAGSISGLVLTAPDNSTIVHLSNGALSWSTIATAESATQIVDLMLGSVGVIDASALQAGFMLDLRAGGSFGVIGGTLDMHSAVLPAAQVIGGAGNDVVISTTGTHAFDGGAGVNTAGYSGLREGYTIGFSGGAVQVTGGGSSDTLTHIEYLQFGDGTIKVPYRSADLSGNGTSDILWRNSANGETVDFLMSGGTVAGAVDLGAIGTAWSICGIGDFNRDGVADVFWRNSVTGEDVIFFMANGSIASAADLGAVGTGWSVVGVEDFDGDGAADILWRNAASGDSVLFRMNGSSIVATPDLGAVSNAWQVAGLGDFDGNGTADILWRNAATGADIVFGMAGGTISSVTDIGAVGSAWTVAGIGDFNGDGTSDIVWRNTTTGAAVLFLMHAGSVSSTADLGGVANPWQLAQIGDFNNDGKADLLWRNPITGADVVFLMNGGTLASVVDIGAVGAVWSVQKPALAAG